MSPRQTRFVAEYAVDGNAAARRAGYSPRCAKLTACRLLTKPNVREALSVSHQATARRLELYRQRVMKGLMEAIELERPSSSSSC